MAEWTSIASGSINVDELTVQVDAVDDVLTTVSGLFEAVGSALKLISAFIVEGSNVLEQAVGVVVQQIEQLVLDLLNNNVSLAVHVNSKWNPDWKYKRSTNDDPRRTPDYANDGALPWIGTGTVGWLLDIAASANDPTDPYRPLTDEDTATFGAIFLAGVPDSGALEDLQGFFDLFTDFSDFRERFNPDYLEDATEGFQALSRLGPVVYDDFMEETSTTTQDQLLRDLDGIKALLDDDLSEFLPKTGDYPHWLSVPVASLLPITSSFFDSLKRLADNLRPAISQANSVARLADTLEARAQILADAVEELSNILVSIESILLFFEGANVIVLNNDAGGLPRFVNDAVAADNLPFYGERGVVAGFVAMSTANDPSDHLEALFDLLGVKFSDLATDVTVRAEGLSDTWDDLFP